MDAPHHSSFFPSIFCDLESSIRTEHDGTQHGRWEAAGPRCPDDDDEHGGGTPFAEQPTEVMKLLHPTHLDHSAPPNAAHGAGVEAVEAATARAGAALAGGSCAAAGERD
jgi:hypothetical protein